MQVKKKNHVRGGQTTIKLVITEIRCSDGITYNGIKINYLNIEADKARF